MRNLVLALILSISAKALALTETLVVPLNSSSQFKEETLIFKSALGEEASLALSAQDISPVVGSYEHIQEYLIKGPVMTNPYLKSFLAEGGRPGLRQRIFFGVTAEQSMETVAFEVADALCKHMARGKNFFALSYKALPVDFQKESKMNATLTGNTYWKNIFFLFNEKTQESSAVNKTIELKFFKDIRGEQIFSLTHITCGER